MSEEAVIASIPASTHEAKSDTIIAPLSTDKTKTKSKSRKKKRRDSDKKNRQGRKGDPRMHHAVAARLADSSISLLDALKIGGFDYPAFEEDVVSSIYAVEDSEGVQLGQRKNQLSRRLRLIRKEADNGGVNKDSDNTPLKRPKAEEDYAQEESDEELEATDTNVVTVESEEVEDVGDGIGVVKVPSTRTSGASSLPPLIYKSSNTSLSSQDKPQGVNKPFNKFGVGVVETSAVPAKTASKMSAASLLSQQSFQKQLALTNLRTYNDNSVSNSENSPGTLRALQHQHQMQLVAAASRSNMTIQSNLGSLLHSDTNSLGSYVQTLYNGMEMRSKGAQPELVLDKYMQQRAPKSDFLDLNSSLKSDISSVSRESMSRGTNSRGSKGGKDASEASSFLNDCKKIDCRDLSPLSTFGMPGKIDNESMSNRSEFNCPPPLFNKLLPPISSTKPSPSSVTPTPSIPKFKSEPDADDETPNTETATKNTARAKKFKEFFKMQRSFVQELFELAGKDQDEEKLRIALDCYRVESASLVKSSMIKAGFGPETIHECDKNYLAFVAREFDFEIRRVERLIDVPPPPKRKKNAASVTKQTNASKKRVKPNIGFSPENHQRRKSSCSESKANEIIFDNSKQMNMKHDEISSLGHILVEEPVPPNDEDFIPMRVSFQDLTKSSARPTSNSAIQTMNHFTNTLSVVKTSTRKSQDNYTGSSPPVMNVQEYNNPIQILTFTEQELKKAVLVHESSISKILTTSVAGTKVAVKVLNMECPSAIDVKRLFNEYAITRSVSHSGVRKALDRVLFNNKHALVLEWVDGQTVKEIGKCTITDFLHIARQISAALIDIHAHGIMHMSLTYDNIMMCSADKTVRIIDFRYATRFYTKNPFLQHSEDRCREECLPFIAPEQTGRVNFMVDSRSDLYSLGIVFYFLLAGKLPFEAQTPAEWMTMHATEPVRPLKHLNCSVPGPLSDLISMLLEKNPDQRYLSAESLLFDLDIILLENQLYGNSSTRSIATRNFSRHLIIPQKLYGKDEAKDTLMSSWKRVNSSQGSAESIFINGSSGVGKSKLLSELRNAVTNRQTITVKFSSFSVQEPFAALISTVRHWINTLVLEGDEMINNISNAISKEIGKIGQMFLSCILGSIPALFGKEFVSVEQLNDMEVALGVDVESRLHQVFQKLFQCLSSAKYPIVLILEDIHLADPHSLNFFSISLTQECFQKYLLIFTYDQSKISTNESSFSFLQKSFTNNKIPVTKIELKNLTLVDVNSFCADVFHCTYVKSKNLSNFIYKQSGGNIHFVIQLLMLLSDRGLLHFCQSSYVWVWDMDLISKEILPLNVEDLYRQKILQLDHSTQKLLKVAAYVDNPFSLSMLDLVSDVSVHGHVDLLLEDGILVPISPHGSKFHFANNIIQTLAYSLIPELERNVIHMKTETALLRNVNKQELENKLFSIGNHFDSGWESITEPSQKIEAARMFLHAGYKAKLLAAFPLAVQYVTCAIQLIKPIYWKEEYELSLKLTNTLAEVSFYIKDFDIMQESIHQISRNATSIVHRVPSVSLYIKSLYSQRKYKEALSAGMTILEQLGESFPKIISETLVLPELQKTKDQLMDKLQDISLGVKVNENHVALATLRILTELVSLCPVCEPALRTYIIIRFMQIILQHGKSKYTSYGLALFGLVLFTELEDIRDGYRFVKLAVSLLDNSNEQGLLPRIYTCYYISMLHWKEHVHLSLPPLLKSFKLSLELGCSVPTESSSSYILLNYGINCVCSGKSLEELVPELSTLSRRLHPRSSMLDTFLNILCCLVSKVECDMNISTLINNDSFWLKYQVSASNHFETFVVYLLRMILSYYFNEIVLAKTCAAKCQELFQHVEHSYSYSVFFFYYGLISTSYSRRYPVHPITQMNVLPKLKKWSIHSSSNYLSKLYFLEAEMAVGNDSTPQQQIMYLYNESISLARSNNFHHEEALACERMTDLCVEWKEIQKAKNYYHQALKRYETWGCNAKVKELVGRYSGLLEDNIIKIEK